MELPKALSVRRTFLSAIFHLLSRLPTAPLLRQLWFVGTPQVPQPLCREGVAAKLDGLQMPLDCRRSSSQALVHRRENGDAWLAQRSLRNVLWLSNEKILEEPGQKCRHVNEFTPPAQRVEKGILEFTTLQGSCHPTLRLGGQRLMEKAFLPHPPSGLVATEPGFPSLVVSHRLPPPSVRLPRSIVSSVSTSEKPPAVHLATTSRASFSRHHA